MSEKKLTERESLQIIEQMILTAKQEQKDDGKTWIIWGWLLFFASGLTYFNIQYKWFDTFFFWNGFGIAAGLFLLYGVSRYLFFSKALKVKTYTSDLYKKLNIGFFIFLMLIIVSINKGVSPVKGFALLIALYGFWVLIYGTVLNFRPSIIGAFITMGIALCALFIEEDFQLVMILHSTAALVGYIIPGYIANREFNKARLTKNT